MNDWKDALSALTGVPVPETETETMQCKHPGGAKDVSRKKRSGVVYSTDAHYAYESTEEDEQTTLPANRQPLRVSMERAGRAGKTVTLVRGFVGSTADLQTLCRLLKQRCGVGGSAKDGEMVIQGDHRQKVVDVLRKEGYTQVKG